MYDGFHVVADAHLTGSKHFSAHPEARFPVDRVASVDEFAKDVPVAATNIGVGGRDGTAGHRVCDE